MHRGRGDLQPIEVPRRAHAACLLDEAPPWNASLTCSRMPYAKARPAHQNDGAFSGRAR